MSSKPLRAPVRELLDDALTEHEVQELWARIAVPRRRAAPPLAAWALALATVTVLVVLVLRRQFENPTAVRLADLRELPALVSAATDERLSLSDGSLVVVQGGSRLETLENTGKAVSLALRYGRVSFEVRPGGPRTWRVECGAVTVEVVGTRFSVERAPEHVTVSVERGVVLVRGDPVPDRVVRLTAGMSTTVTTTPPSEPRSSVAAPMTLAPVSAPSATAAPPLEAQPATEHSNASVPLASLPAAPEISFPAQSAPAAASTTEPASLFQAADVARRQGRSTDAVSILTRLLDEYPADPRAPFAELTLGRIYLDALGRPEVAGEYLTRALRRGLPAALAEEASARAVEAYARAGDSLHANEARARYLNLYPNGARAAYVDRWAPPRP